jgi:DNA-directed RNA polymerase specialized sigma24 family protein
VSADEFEERLAPVLGHLRGVLVARHGIEIGVELHSDLASYAWEQRTMLCGLDNPAGYLFRVSQSRARRYRRWSRTVQFPAERAVGIRVPDGDQRLDDALTKLSKDERTVAVLVHGYGYSYDEAAEVLGWTVGSVRSRLHRAMAKLRHSMNEEGSR